MPCRSARQTPTRRSWRPGRCIGLAALLLAITTEGLQNAAADGETRTLSFHHTHTGEDLTVTFKRNGRYDEAELAKLNYFLRDWRNNDQTKMDPRLFDVVWEVYHDVDAKQPIRIISAYRSPTTNAMLRKRSRGVAKFSQHMLGKAMDFNIPNVPLAKIRVAGLRLQRGGVGFYPSSGSPFVHLDIGSVRHWPRMSHDQLVQVFPHGRTVHMPSDGRPLPGYAQALADIERRGTNLPSRVSLAQARDAGVDVKTQGKGRRDLLARLFGFGEDEDEDVTGGGRATFVKPAEAAPPAQAPTRVASAVPLPRTRPGAREAVRIESARAEEAPAENTRVASAAPVVAGPMTPAQIVDARGLWRAADLLDAASSVGAVAHSQPRSRPAQRTAARSVVIDGTTTRITKTTASARREAAVAIATAGSDITGSLPPWVREMADAAGETVMAYAAPSAPERTASTPAPMGAFKPARGAHIQREAPARASTSPSQDAPVRAGLPVDPNRRLLDSPWLRGVIASPSVRTAMAVTMMGAPNYRVITQLMRKPGYSVANAFVRSEEAAFALDTQSFRGAAVAFVPVVTFGTLTAELR